MRRASMIMYILCMLAITVAVFGGSLALALGWNAAPAWAIPAVAAVVFGAIGAVLQSEAERRELAPEDEQP